MSGTVDVYKKGRTLPALCKRDQKEGRGELFLRFEKLRDELEEMGMFDGRYKQPILNMRKNRHCYLLLQARRSVIL